MINLISVASLSNGNKPLLAPWCSCTFSCAYSRSYWLLFLCLPRDQRPRSAAPLITRPSGLPSFFFHFFHQTLILMTSSEPSLSSEFVPEGWPVSRAVAHQYHSLRAVSLARPRLLYTPAFTGQIRADDFIFITFASFPLAAASQSVHFSRRLKLQL